MQRSWSVGLVPNLTKTILLFSLLGVLGSCGKKPESDLVIKLSPPDSPILQMDAYSCAQRIEGITDTTTGNPVTPKYKGPVVIFNRMTMEWKKSTKLFVTQAKIKFVGSGIQGGEETCELSPNFFDFFERDSSAGTQSPVGIYSADTFLGKGMVTTNSKCRVICSITLADPERPEISASAELSVRAVELTNEGKEDEKYFRVKSTFRARIVP